AAASCFLGPREQPLGHPYPRICSRGSRISWHPADAGHRGLARAGNQSHAGLLRSGHALRAGCVLDAERRCARGVGCASPPHGPVWRRRGAGRRRAAAWRGSRSLKAEIMALLVACRHRGLAALAVTTLLMTAACGDSTGPDLEDAVMERFDGDGQDGNADEPLASPLQVRILDAEGLPVAGVVVTWDVIAGGGTVTPTSVTDQDGIAEATFTLGPANGEHQATATVPGLTGSPATFTAIAG